MRGLFGDFSTMPLRDLVVYLGNKRVTGTLHLERADIHKSVDVRAGMVINAGSNDPREYLGQFLINMGHITEDQFNKAYETQKETHIFLGKILVMIGAVSEDVVLTTLSLKIRETLLEAFGWTEGTFRFDAEATPKPLEGIDVQIDLLDVHREGEFRETAWQAIRAAFPAGNARLELHPQNLPEPPRPGSLDDRLFALIRGGSTIDEMVLALHATDFYLYQRLYALYRLEAVTVAETIEEVAVFEDEPLGGEFVIGEEAGAGDVLGHAKAFLAQGRLDEAEALARQAQELEATAAGAELLQTIERAQAEQLRQRLVAGGKVAVLKVPAARLKELSLTAPERYLLSRVDGTRQVGAIVQVSPLRELDALRFFRKFVEAGLVDVR